MIYFFNTIGQDSHRFVEIAETSDEYIMLGGVKIPSERRIEANSDGDVLLHAITNAISGATGVNILGAIADDLCLRQGIKDSSVYLEEALKYMGNKKLIHLSISIECLTPKLSKYIDSIKNSLSGLLTLDKSHIGITATTGEGLTEFGKGNGIQVFVIASFMEEV